MLRTPVTTNVYAKASFDTCDREKRQATSDERVKDEGQIFNLASGGFAITVRLAKSNPVPMCLMYDNYLLTTKTQSSWLPYFQSNSTQYSVH